MTKWELWDGTNNYVWRIIYNMMNSTLILNSYFIQLNRFFLMHIFPYYVIKSN